MTQTEVEALRTALAAHETADTERHEALMVVLGEIRDGQRRTVAVWLAEIGTDPVVLPFTGGGSVKLRTLYGLAVLTVGTLLALGIGGDTAARWVDHLIGSDASAEQIAPTPDAASPPEPTP